MNPPRTKYHPTGLRLIYNQPITLCKLNQKNWKRNDSIDFVLMDLRLPVLDGFEATSRIKGFKPWLPIIAVSAYNIGEEYARCMEAGCDAFIRKPLNTTLLMDTMKKLFHHYDKDK